MVEKSIENWVEEDLRVDKEERINEFRDRIEKFIRNKDGSLKPIGKDLGTQPDTRNFDCSCRGKSGQHARDGCCGKFRVL